MTLPLNEFGCVRMSGEELRAIARAMLLKWAEVGALRVDARPDASVLEGLLLGELERRHPNGRLGGVAGNGAPYEDPIVSRCRDVALELGVVRDDSPASHDRSIGAWLSDAIAFGRRRAAKEETPAPLPFGALADLLGGGLWDGAHLLVGAPGSGKSALCVQVAVGAALAGHPVSYVALELGGVELAMRAASEVAARAGLCLPWSHLLRGIGIAGLETVRAGMDDLPLTICEGDAHGWEYARIGDVARQAAENAGGRIPLVILDYLQLVQGPERDLRERVSRAAYACRTAARDHRVAVLAISSAARHLYEPRREGVALLNDPDAPPLAYISAGKESGDVEFAADSVMALCRHDGAASVVVAKQRAGETGRAFLQWNGGRFTATTHE